MKEWLALYFKCHTVGLKLYRKLTFYCKKTWPLFITAVKEIQSGTVDKAVPATRVSHYPGNQTSAVSVCSGVLHM